MSDLSQRLTTAIVLVAAFLLALYWAPAPLWAGFVGLFLAAAAWEWAGLAGLAAAPRWLFTLAILTFSAAITLADVAGVIWVYLPALLFWAILAPLWLWRRWPAPGAASAVLLGAVLLASAFLALLHLRAESPSLLLAILGIPIVADSAAYFSGRRFGRRKLAPAISPGKTWEGAIGAALTVGLYALGCGIATERAVLPLLGGMLFLFVLSVFGDLFESWLKRQAGVKDSGRLLPGHGGVLDRIDSQLAVLPAATLLWIGFK